MKKFDWGHGLTIFYILFVIVIATALYASTKVDHSLVRDDYYQLDLDYQKRYNKMERSSKLGLLKVDYSKSNKEMVFRFKSTQSPTGTISFYRAADSQLDFNKTINSKQLRVNTAQLPKGKWKVNVDWKADGNSFYYEEDFIL